MLESNFPKLNELTVFASIKLIRDSDVTDQERSSAEALLYLSLRSISGWFAHIRSTQNECDADQVVNTAIGKLFVGYIRNPDFQFLSCGHLISLVGKITTNERRMAYRRNNRAKRVPQDADGQRLRVESLDLFKGNCPSKSEDPGVEYEHNEQIQRYFQCLTNLDHQRVFLMLTAEFTWAEMATNMNVDLKSVRRLVGQMRRILSPVASRLKQER